MQSVLYVFIMINQIQNKNKVLVHIFGSFRFVLQRKSILTFLKYI